METRGVYILRQSDDVFDLFLITCTSKWLSYVIVISQLHVDMETEPSEM